MDFKKFWRGLGKAGQEAFSKKCGLSVQMVRNQYLSPNPERRPMPSKQRLADMVVHSNQQLTIEGLAKYFCVEGVSQMLAEQKEKSPISGA